MGKKSSKTTSSTVYGNTTTKNPYITSKTNNDGTVSAFNNGTAFDIINSFVNNNMDELLEQYLNPTLNSITNRAKMNAFTGALASNSAKSLENDIISPLSQRNMIRSSQATDLYNSLLRNNSNAISNYANELIATNQQDMASMLKTLLTAYMSGYTALADTQSQSLKASQGNASSTNKTSNGGGADMSEMMDLAVNLALLVSSL